MDQPTKTLIEPPKLNGIQVRVLTLAAAGASQREMARQIGCIRGTVRNVCDQVETALGAKNMTHAVANALRLGLIT